MECETVLQAALTYAQLGLAVIPLRGKIPYLDSWPEKATRDFTQIRKWWAEEPSANVGIATGEKSGLFVFDVDVKKGGQVSVDSLFFQHGRFTATWTQTTGGGGTHYFFRYPAIPIHNQTGLMPGIDIRGIGGQVVAAPSIHPETKQRYIWDGLQAPWDDPDGLAEAPAWLLDMLKTPTKKPGEPIVPEKIPKGVQHAKLVSLAGLMRNAGLTPDEIFPALMEVNRNRCEEPGPEKNIRQIAKSMGKYEPGDLKLFALKSPEPAQLKDIRREFIKVDDDRYRLTAVELATSVEVKRVRWEHNSLVGTLNMHSDLPGAKSASGNLLSSADFNISGPDARQKRAKFLIERVSNEYDWISFMEDFCHRILYDQMSPPKAVRLIDIPEPSDEERWIRLPNINILGQHPTILFGDGGSAKSYLALYFAGLIARMGVNVALFDWEFAGGEHRRRYRFLFGDDMPPNLFYLREKIPLPKREDALRDFVRDHSIGFIIFDSVGLACGGAPELAESALQYWAAADRVCISGSLHIAHTTKPREGPGAGSGKDNSEMYPYGSIYWHNKCRMSWFIHGAEESPNSPVLNVAMHNRKANVGGRLSAPLGFTLVFAEDRTTIRRSDPTENPDLATKIPLWRRMEALLRRGSLSHEEIAETTGYSVKSVRSECLRKSKMFLVAGGKVGLRTAELER